MEQPNNELKPSQEQQPESEKGQSLPALPVKQEKALLALLEHDSLKGAASALGVNRTTLYRWMQEPAFRAQYQAIQRETTNFALGRLKQLMTIAVSLLKEAVVRDEVPFHLRLAAANSILDHAMQALKLDEARERPSQAEENAQNKLPEAQEVEPGAPKAVEPMLFAAK